MTPDLILTIGFFFAALLYSSVGHGGASAYLAVMSLAGVALDVMRPTALALNIPVSLIAAIRFHRAGYFRWSLFWPFALLAIPLANVGGRLPLPAATIKIILGCVLIFSAIRLLFLARLKVEENVQRPTLTISLLCGGILGFAAGVSGTGGGIFLSPLLLLMRWATTRETAAVSALFILCNSIAGLWSNWAGIAHIPGSIVWCAVAAISGGLVGSHFGSRRLAPASLRILLAVVLLLAGGKFLGFS